MICQTNSQITKKIGKCFKSPNTTNLDLLTIVSLNTQRSNEFLTSYNTNTYIGDFCNFDIMLRNVIKVLVNGQNAIKK
jgi:hypothetical protein